jgi:hypothetical protein
MTIVSRLSSQIGDKTEEGNRIVAQECLQNPNLLEEIKEGLSSKDKALIGDCAEVMTKVAEVKPELVAPYSDDLLPLLSSKTTRVRWEAIHAISFITTYIPDQISLLLPKLKELITADKSTIVRDYSVQTICNYADVGKKEALTAFPILKESLTLWEGKHRGRILNGFLNVCNQAPECILEIRGIAEEYVEDNRSGVKKAAKALIKAIDKGLV